MTKELLVMECVNINSWYNQTRQDRNKLNGLSVKALWALRKNMKKISEITDSFNDFKEGLENELKEDFFNNEKSEEVTIKDENGNDTPAQKIKDEFLKEYQDKINEINHKLSELALSKEQLDFTAIDIESEIDRLGADCNLNMDDLDILSVFEQNEKDA